MTGEILFVFLLLWVTIILFVSDRLRLDVVEVVSKPTIGLKVKAD